MIKVNFEQWLLATLIGAALAYAGISIYNHATAIPQQHVESVSRHINDKVRVAAPNNQDSYASFFEGCTGEIISYKHQEGVKYEVTNVECLGKKYFDSLWLYDFEMREIK